MNFSKDTTGVVVVDVQGDFTQLKQGTLAVEGTGAEYVQKVIQASEDYYNKGYPLFATQDYHPENHISFFTNHAGKAPMDVVEVDGRSQVMWPPHCVKGTMGADLLVSPDIFNRIVQKGCDPEFDSYSGFFDDGGAPTGLESILKEQGLSTLIMYGLATDYCVKATALDAVKTGFRVVLVKDLCMGVAPETTESALEEMKNAGIEII